MSTPTLLAVIAVSATVLALPVKAGAEDSGRHRGDANGSGGIDISDPIHILVFLFGGGPSPSCPAAADANASGNVDIADAAFLLDVLFSSGGELEPLTEAETRSCEEPVVLRSGILMGRLPQATEERGVDGIAEQLSNRVIRLRQFYYDGQGAGRVYVWLHRGGDLRLGHPISANINKPYPGYEDETLEFPIPESITDDMFHSVAIWCYDFDQNFGSARLQEP